MPPTTATLHGNFRKADGSGVKGVLLFEPTDPVVWDDNSTPENVVTLTETEFKVKLEDGKFSVKLYTTDDANWSGTWHWQVTEQLINTPTKSYKVAFTGDSALSELAIVE